MNSTYWSQSDEVAAFEELVGSHGGLGGGQSYPFLMHPADLAVPPEEMVGAEAVHRLLRAWLVELGHDVYAAPRTDAGDHEELAGMPAARERRDREGVDADRAREVSTAAPNAERVMKS